MKKNITYLKIIYLNKYPQLNSFNNLLILIILLFSSIFLLSLVGLFIHNIFYYYMVFFFMINYNFPIIKYNIDSVTTNTYMYKRSVYLRYLFFTISENNIFLMLTPIVLLVSIIANYNMSLTIFYALFLNLIFYVFKLHGGSFLLTLYLMLGVYIGTTSNLLLLSTFLLFTLIIILLYLRNYQKFIRHDNESYFQNHNTYFQQKNMYIYLYIKYLLNRSIKDIFTFIIYLLLIFAFSQLKISMFNFMDLILLFFLLDLELYIDKSFKHIRENTNKYNCLKLINNNNKKLYFFSYPFHLSITYLITLIIIFILNINHFYFMNLFITILIINLLAQIYYYLYQKMIKYQKKSNTLFVQYLIFIGLILLVTLKNMYF